MEFVCLQNPRVYHQYRVVYRSIKTRGNEIIGLYAQFVVNPDRHSRIQEPLQNHRVVDLWNVGLISRGAEKRPYDGR